jgi:cellulose synthase/poly-beta-1,6-N-acetylglucosamine synthase-like glycosyltransferase
MEYLFYSLVLLAITLCIAYVLLIASYCYGWINTPTLKITNTTSVFVSIVIAARNEEATIIRCLNAVCNQSYPAHKIEIIVIDDASEDTTNQLIQAYCTRFSNLKLITIDATSENVGKKNAINEALKVATGELIVTTDADCEMGNEWLQSIVSCYKTTNAAMIVAPVCFHHEKNIFEKMQSLEFMALIACGGASLHYHQAIMCNGANLAYTKKAVEAVNGLEDLTEKASGDDVLLMYKIKQKYPKGIVFLKDEKAIVYTEAKNTLKEFVQQRKRWASKGFKNLNTETKMVSLIVYFFNASLLFLPLIGSICFKNTALCPVFIEICLILLVIKCFIDFLLLFLSASFFKKKRLLLYFIPEQLIYMLYVAIVGWIGSIGQYEWKGRKLK